MVATSAGSANFPLRALNFHVTKLLRDERVGFRGKPHILELTNEFLLPRFSSNGSIICRTAGQPEPVQGEAIWDVNYSLF